MMPIGPNHRGKERKDNRHHTPAPTHQSKARPLHRTNAALGLVRARQGGEGTIDDGPSPSRRVARNPLEKEANSSPGLDTNACVGIEGEGRGDEGRGDERGGDERRGRRGRGADGRVQRGRERAPLPSAPPTLTFCIAAS